MGAPQHWIFTAFITLSAFACWNAVAQTAGATQKSPELQALEDELALLEARGKILAKKREMLKSETGEGVDLPAGTIERDSAATLPSAITYVAYDALRPIADQICLDIGDLQTSPPTAGMAPPAPLTVLLASFDDIRTVREQRLAMDGYLRGITDRVQEQSAALRAPTSGPRVVMAVTATLLAIDEIAAVGKAIAGLAGFFKTDRKIGIVESVLTVEHVMLALRTCEPRVTLVSPLLTNLSDTDIFGIIDAQGTRTGSKVEEALKLRDAAQVLRRQIVTRQGRIDTLKRETAALKVQISETEDAEAKKPLQEKQKEKELQAEIITAEITEPKSVLGVADMAVQALYTVDSTTHVSPLINLARMTKVLEILDRLGERAKLFAVKVQHASGYSQISKAWWRSDRLDFAAGVAVSYELTSNEGVVEKANMYFVQTPWRRLDEESSKFSGHLTSLKRTSSVGTQSSR